MYLSQSTVVTRIFKPCGTLRLFSPLEGKFYVCPQKPLNLVQGDVDVIGKGNYTHYFITFAKFPLPTSSPAI
jgi:hypothetical protein